MENEITLTHTVYIDASPLEQIASCSWWCLWTVYYSICIDHRCDHAELAARQACALHVPGKHLEMFPPLAASSEFN